MFEAEVMMRLGEQLAAQARRERRSCGPTTARPTDAVLRRLGPAKRIITAAEDI